MARAQRNRAACLFELEARLFEMTESGVVANEMAYSDIPNMPFDLPWELKEFRNHIYQEEEKRKLHLQFNMRK